MSGYAEGATTRRRQAGFTLIEVMVAIMLMAIVSLMAWRGLDSIARASAHLEDSTEQGAALLRALNQLERDIALHSAIREETGLPIGDEPIRAGDSLPPGLALKRLSEIPLRLDIVRASTEPGAPLQRVRWWRQGNILYRAASPSGDRLPLPPLAERVAVLDDVSRFEIRAWVPGRAGRACRHAAKSAPADWRSAWRGSPATAWSAIDGWWPYNRSGGSAEQHHPARQAGDPDAIGIADQGRHVGQLIEAETGLDPASAKGLVQQQEHAGTVAVDFVDHRGQRYVVEHQHALAPGHHLGNVERHRRTVASLVEGQLLAGLEVQALAEVFEPHAALQAGHHANVTAAAHIGSGPG